MLCAGNIVPLATGANIIEFCYDYFEPASRHHAQPAFVLHVLGRSSEEQSAQFALLPTDPSRPSHWFTARWGRQGSGSTNFMPVPAHTEDARPGINLYGHKTSNFTWRSCQWEIAETHAPRSLDIPSLDGEIVEEITNSGAYFALRQGLPVADIDSLAPGEHPNGLEKEAEAKPDSFLIHFGGRIWRRHLDPEAARPLEILAFDPQSPVLQSALDEVWAEIGGQDEAKRELIRAIQWPVLYPELFQLFKRRRSRGVLLYGPPGCGKTLLGKAVVKLLASLYHRKAHDGGFKYVKGHQLLDQYVGNSEKAVKALFDDARRWREQAGYPAVLFFDEADALFKRRAGVDGGFTLVPSLLAEMDGMDESGAFVMLATNRPDSLDVAITRPGRVDRKIRITRPQEEAAARIFEIHLAGVYLGEDLTAAGLSHQAARELFDARHRLYEVTFEDDSAKVDFLLQHLASGALVHNIVDRATANKMEKCIETGVTAGLDLTDLRQAVAEVLAEHRQSRHPEELLEFAEARRRRLATVAQVAE
jgi:hypothetical protein